MFFFFFFSFLLQKKVSSFLFSCISFKYFLLLALVSEFNCFLRGRCSMEIWCPDDIGRDSWDFGGPPAWGRACFNSPESGGGSPPVKTEPPQTVLMLLFLTMVNAANCLCQHVASVSCPRWQRTLHHRGLQKLALNSRRPGESEKCRISRRNPPRHRHNRHKRKLWTRTVRTLSMNCKCGTPTGVSTTSSKNWTTHTSTTCQQEHRPPCQRTATAHLSLHNNGTSTTSNNCTWSVKVCTVGSCLCVATGMPNTLRKN